MIKRKFESNFALLYINARDLGADVLRVIKQTPAPLQLIFKTQDDSELQACKQFIEAH